MTGDFCKFFMSYPIKRGVVNEELSNSRLFSAGGVRKMTHAKSGTRNLKSISKSFRVKYRLLAGLITGSYGYKCPLSDEF